MADTKISALTDGTTADATDRIPVARSPFGSGDNRYVTPAYIRTYLLGLANTWQATQTITPAVNTNALAVTGFSLTGSNAQSLVDLAGTWNTSGTPTAIKLDVTDTASDADSLLVDLKVGGSSKFKIDKTGGDLAISKGGPDGNGTLFKNMQNTGIYWGQNSGATAYGGISSTGFYLGSGKDTRFSRIAAGILGFHGDGTTDVCALQVTTYGASPPSAGAAGSARIYADTSGGKIRLMVVFPSGAAQQIAIEP